MGYILSVNYMTFNVLLISVLTALILSSVVFLISFVLAIQSPDSEKTSAYECGFEPFEDARNKFDVRFYLVAILFLIFDLEVALLIPWGLSLSFIGIVGYSVGVFFLLFLTIGFIYEVLKGALDSH